MKIKDLLNPELPEKGQKLVIFSGIPKPRQSAEPVPFYYNRKISCSKCSSSFARRSELIRHEKTVHVTADTPIYVCQNCRKSFYRKDLFDTHTSTKKYKERNCKSVQEFLDLKAELKNVAEQSPSRETFQR
jgi:uncharacterized Zn-finger protein